MKVIAVNGSPRKQGNTATLLNHALEGARSVGAETELVHLYDLDYKGCRSCFGCKKVGGPSYGRCATKDGLTPLLEAVPSAGAIILGSPIYCMQVTGEMRSFFERLLYPYLEYAEPMRSLYPGRLKIGLLYTMGMPETAMQANGLERSLAISSAVVNLIFGQPEVLYCCDTILFGDSWQQYVSSGFDAALKEKQKKEVFPIACRHAYQMGTRLAAKV